MRFLHLASAALIATSFAAHADTLQYTFAPVYSYEPTHTFSFQLPSNPIAPGLVVYAPDEVFAVTDISAVADSVPGTFYAVFNFNAPGAGGFVLAGSPYGDEPTFSYSLLSGGPLYSGEPNSPTLLPGTFELQEFGAPYGGDPGLLTVTDLTTAVTPEPSSFLLLGTGLLGLVGLMRKRFA